MSATLVWIMLSQTESVFHNNEHKIFAYSLTIPTYQIGEVFVSLNTDDANSMLEQAKENTKGEIKGLESQCDAIQVILQDLKVKLYTKFGNNIKLEADDE